MTNMAAAIRHRNNTKKRGELLWPRMVMKKWLNIKSTGEEFSADEFSADENEEGKDPDSERESESEYEPSENLSPKRCTTQRLSPLVARRDVNDGQCSFYVDDVPFKGYTDSIKRNEVENFHRHSMGKDELRITVGTWNVGAIMPPPDLDMKDWLDLDNPSDIYVLGFQEIIPLNVGNVFVAEDSVPTAEWQNLIKKTLNRPKPRQSAKCWSAPLSPSKKMALDALDDSEMDTELVEEETNFIPPFSSLKEGEHQSSSGKADLVGVYRRMDRINLSSSRVDRVVSEPIKWPHGDSTHSPVEGDCNQLLFSRISAKKSQTRYIRVASKQMGGIHISIWVKRKLRQYIQNLTVSSVGLGIMGCLGNKGSISVSMLLHGTNFCFICTHLTAGGKEGNELRRNADVTEILRRTRFPSTNDHIKVPKTIMQHDQVIWFGDLNYRLNLSDSDVRFLLAREDWTALLANDQLRKELSRGRTFSRWHEGSISFAPTYKYEMNSHYYSGHNAKAGEKRRTPAWCDRILWHGRGLRQLSYGRQEYTLSDHRPVMASFMAKVHLLTTQNLKRPVYFKIAKVVVQDLVLEPGNPMNVIMVQAALQSAAMSKITAY